MILELRKDTVRTGPSYKCLRGNHGEEVEVTAHTAEATAEAERTVRETSYLVWATCWEC